MLGPVLRPLSKKVFNDIQFIFDGNETSKTGFLDKLLGLSHNVTTTELNLTLEYIDWNDYEFMAKDAQRQGWGEQGTEFNKTLSPEEKQLSDKLFQQYNFNAFASDYISLERSIGDTRTEACKAQKFLKNIPSVSIVMIFRNEKNSTILRSLHSIINKTPAKLLREIVLVDDLSTNQELQEPLENYIRLHFPIVRMIRNTQRHGLIRSRMIGANVTSGDILLFLDAHIEMGHNYLPPLVEPIVLDYRKIMCPMIDTIMFDTMKVRRTSGRERGAFSWDMTFRRLPVNQEDETRPHPVPTMLGAVFAISRKWWDEIEKFDPGLEIWGGEQYEISFKTWQCGGSMMDAPCSKVSHLFRNIPYVQEVVKGNMVERNFLRVARVWMDEYIEYVFQRRPVMRTLDPGDLTEQFALRKRLKCKPFKWYLTEVAPDLVEVFPLIDPPDKAWGLLKSYNGSLCVLARQYTFYLDSCERATNEHYTYTYNWRQHIRFVFRCFANPNGRHFFLYDCLYAEKDGPQNFVWDRKSGRIVNIHTHLCVDVDINTLNVYTTECDISKITQSWTFQYFNSTIVDEAWEKYRVQVGFK